MKSRLTILAITCFTALTSIVASASPETEALGISADFPGTYAIQERTGKGAHFGCSDYVKVEVTEKAVSVRAGKSGGKPATFLAEQEGCRKGGNDISLSGRKVCTTFKKRHIKRTDTGAATIVGYVRTYEGIRLTSNPNVLIYENDLTAIPFGVLGLFDQDKFKCTYVRTQ